MHIGVQNEARAKYRKHGNCQSKGVKHSAPNKARFIVHELISQIPCFRIMKESLLLMQNQEDQKII